MALLQEVWIKDIQENLYMTNPFLKYAMDDSAYLAFGVVHVPQAGANPTVLKNRNSFPATITQRTDSDYTYTIDQFSTDPILVSNLEASQISYDKRRSVMGQHLDMLSQSIGSVTLYNWASTLAARQTYTTGALVGTNLAPSATGTRRALQLADIFKLRSILDKDNVPMSGRKLIIDSDTYNLELMAIANINAQYSYGSATLPTGVVNQIAGFDVIVRPQVVVYGTNATPSVLKTIGANGNPTSPAVTDCKGVAIAYHPDFVSVALGATRVAYNTYEESAGAYYGDIFSALQWFGAAPRRTNGVGIATLIQANS